MAETTYKNMCNHDPNCLVSCKILCDNSNHVAIVACPCIVLYIFNYWLNKDPRSNSAKAIGCELSTWSNFNSDSFELEYVRKWDKNIPS